MVCGSLQKGVVLVSENLHLVAEQPTMKAKDLNDFHCDAHEGSWLPQQTLVVADSWIHKD